MWSISHRQTFSSAPTLSLHTLRFRIERNQDYLSKKFERWKELAARWLGEQDPAKLTELASEMNLVLTQKTPGLDPPLHAAGAHEKGQRDVLKANAEGKVCFT
jgi:hypothetical protein